MAEEADDRTSDERSEGGSILERGGVDTDARAGRSLGLKPDQVPDAATRQEIEAERARRLDSENRPDTAEVDNTGRTFDVERGQFTDSPEYDAGEPPRFSDPEDPNHRPT